MKTYKQNPMTGTTIERNESREGESIEMKVERIVNNKEPIKDGAPKIYTERKDGVPPGYNIRTDRFEVAIDGMDIISKSITAKRDNKPMEKPEEEQKGDGETEPIQGTK